MGVEASVGGEVLCASDWYHTHEKSQEIVYSALTVLIHKNIVSATVTTESKKSEQRLFIVSFLFDPTFSSEPIPPPSIFAAANAKQIIKTQFGNFRSNACEKKLCIRKVVGGDNQEKNFPR